MNIICLSHLRWNFVYQRPQHLMSRMALHFRTFFIEEPVFDSGQSFYEIIPGGNNISVIVPHVSRTLDPANIQEEQQRLFEELCEEFSIHEFIVWIYSPMMVPVIGRRKPSLTVYDCMDELSAFKNAPADLAVKEAVLFSMADLVFTGGKSLYEAKRYKHPNVFLFPSSIDRGHFEKGRRAQPAPAEQALIPTPRIGFFGVIDERMDLELLDEIAAQRPGWNFVLIGPVVKIDADILPRRSNIHYLGQRSYDQLPVYLSGWDVAMMPFALNESTKYISPTKTPEFLAAGKPVVSTAINDVVTTYGDEGLVHIAGSPEEFIEGIEKAMQLKEDPHWLKAVDSCLAKTSWDDTASKMLFLINTCLEKSIDQPTKRESYV